METLQSQQVKRNIVGGKSHTVVVVETVYLTARYLQQRLKLDSQDCEGLLALARLGQVDS